MLSVLQTAARNLLCASHKHARTFKTLAAHAFVATYKVEPSPAGAGPGDARSVEVLARIPTAVGGIQGVWLRGRISLVVTDLEKATRGSTIGQKGSAALLQAIGELVAVTHPSDSGGGPDAATATLLCASSGSGVDVQRLNLDWMQQEEANCAVELSPENAADAAPEVSVTDASRGWHPAGLCVEEKLQFKSELGRLMAIAEAAQQERENEQLVRDIDLLSSAKAAFETKEDDLLFRLVEARHRNTAQEQWITQLVQQQARGQEQMVQILRDNNRMLRSHERAHKAIIERLAALQNPAGGAR
jgi:hypothetical protein